MTGDMAPPSAPPSVNSLRLRVASAAVLLPLAVIAIWLGGWWAAVFLGAIGGAMCWEWGHICSPDRPEVAGLMASAGVLAPLLAVVFGFAAVAAVAVAGTAVLAILAVRLKLAHGMTLAAGLPYVVVGISSVGWLRGSDDGGFAPVMWVAFSVIATDVGAYSVGRNVGGPKLAPRISPNKTWSGLAGGMVAAGAVGIVTALIVGGSIAALAAGSVALAVISQLGDLIESGLKRKFHLKDASRLIPGHGGFLDRFDGYLTAMPAAALMSALSGGSPVTWQ